MLRLNSFCEITETFCSKISHSNSISQAWTVCVCVCSPDRDWQNCSQTLMMMHFQVLLAYAHWCLTLRILKTRADWPLLGRIRSTHLCAALMGSVMHWDHFRSPLKKKQNLTLNWPALSWMMMMSSVPSHWYKNWWVFQVTIYCLVKMFCFELCPKNVE